MRPFWDALDIHLAFALNSIVRDNHTVQMISAFANLRVFDYIAAVGLLAIVVCYVIAGTNAPRAI